MPQMMPINWILSFISFIVIFILFNIMNYYMINIKLDLNNSLSPNILNSKKKKILWKW